MSLPEGQQWSSNTMTISLRQKQTDLVFILVNVLSPHNDVIHSVCSAPSIQEKHFL